MSLKVYRAYPESGLDGSGASLDEDISDTIDVMPSGFTYTCGDFSPWFISLQRWFQQGNGIIAPLLQILPLGKFL